MLIDSAAVAVETPETYYEQRSEPRHSGLVERAVILFRGEEIPVPVIDISSRGTQIESDIQPRLGENLIIQFESCSRVHGFVRWARDGKLGIRFGHELTLAS